MTLLSVILTVVVLIAIAVAVLLFERRRARQIQHDLREMAAQHGGPREPPPRSRPVRRPRRRR